jgi:cytoskeletal protein CcmA (bactofilin family)
MATDTTQTSGCVGDSRSNVSTISSELLINGNVTSTGKIRLDGHVQGDIHCTSLVLGENAQLKGSAVAEEIMVGGRLIGSVRAVRLRLQATSHVEGDLLCESLAIEPGAHFDGKSQRSDDPLSPQRRQVGRDVQKVPALAQQLPPPNEKLVVAIVPSLQELERSVN